MPLVLRRRVGESILISPQDGIDPATPISEIFADGPIEITINEIIGSRVSLDISAPDEILILRDELDTDKEADGKHVDRD